MQSTTAERKCATVCNRVIIAVTKLFENVTDPAHDINHIRAVAEHTAHAIISSNDRHTLRHGIPLLLAAWLHEVDDVKLFGTQPTGDTLSQRYPNASQILIDVGHPTSEHEEVLQIIDYVSCSHNSGRNPPERWMAIVRDCDRLEAIGIVGIKRCFDYSCHKGMPLHVATDPIVRTEEDIDLAATSERYVNYAGKSVSMVGHYFDKLFHVGKPENLFSQNPHVLQVAEERHKKMSEFVIQYWSFVESVANNEYNDSLMRTFVDSYCATAAMKCA
jgi:uncharacterized protein